MNEETENIVREWVNIVKIPNIVDGDLVERQSHVYVSLTYMVDDYSRKCKRSFKKFFQVPKSLFDSADRVEDGCSIVENPFGTVATQDSKVCCYSPSRKYKAVLLEENNQNDSQKNKEIIQIWSKTTLYKSFDLAELDLHGPVYSKDDWGITFCWSGDESKIAFVAEKKEPKSKPFFTSDVTKLENDVSGGSTESKTKDKIGEEYILQQSWGEQMSECFQSVVVILDVQSGVFKVLDLPEDIFPFDISWLGSDAIIGTALTNPIWRLGLIYCSNRESRIFRVNSDGSNLQFLSSAGLGSYSPRVRPDGKYVVWVQNPVSPPQPHWQSVSLIGLPIDDKAPVSSEPKELYSHNPDTQIPIFGRLASKCWSSDGTKLYACTPNDGMMKLISFRFQNDTVSLETLLHNVDEIFWIDGDYLLLKSSTSISSGFTQLMQLSTSKTVQVTNETRPISQDVRVSFIDGEVSPPSIYVGYTPEQDGNTTYPLIVYPHGGPHSCFLDSFSYEIAFFLKLGFCVLKLNYIGSIGGRKDTGRNLMGFIGEKDVEDCHNTVMKVLNEIPNINSGNVVLCGGSHGGFLSAHLSSRYPEVYKGVVLRNPVTDIQAMVASTDITDWCYAESGVVEKASDLTIVPSVSNSKDGEIYRIKSPITYAQNVRAPTLLLLGKDDLRVPMSQGIAYYRKLLAYGKTAQVRVYPDCHPLKKVAVQMDSVIHAAIWLKKCLR